MDDGLIEYLQYVRMTMTPFTKNDCDRAMKSWRSQSDDARKDLLEAAKAQAALLPPPKVRKPALVPSKFKSRTPETGPTRTEQQEARRQPEALSTQPKQQPQEVVQVATARFVTIGLASVITGLTKRAIEGKVFRGEWADGKQYRKALDGRIYIDMAGFSSWVQGQG